MSYISKIKVGNQTYDIADLSVRNQMSEVSNSLSTLTTTIESLQSAVGNAQSSLQEI